MEGTVSQGGRKRRLVSERSRDKRRRMCSHEKGCELTTKVLVQESTIRNLTAVVEDLLGRIAALEGQLPSTISIDHTRPAKVGISSAAEDHLQAGTHKTPPESSKRQICPVDNCRKVFGRTEHLHRHIRGVCDNQHQTITHLLDETSCMLCNRVFKRPCDLVRHERSFHGEKYVSRAYKFTYLISPTQSYTSSSTSEDLDDIGSESDEEDVEGLFDVTPEVRSFSNNLSSSNSSDEAVFMFPNFPNNSLFFDGALFDSQGNPHLNDDNNYYIFPTLPDNSVFFDGALFDEGHLDNVTVMK